MKTTDYQALIGQKVKFIPSHYSGKGENVAKQVVYGTVKWVHPRGRYMLVEYKTKSGCKLRECLLIPRHSVKG